MFHSARGSRYIDLTLAKNIEVADWTVLDEETLSGYSYIELKIRLRGELDRGKASWYDFENMGWDN